MPTDLTVQKANVGETMSSAPEISRTNPAYFLFLIDQSGSMEQKIAGQADGINKMNAGQADGINKMNAAADQVNRTIQAVAITSTSASSATTPTTKALPSCTLPSPAPPIEEPYLPISAGLECGKQRLTSKSET